MLHRLQNSLVSTVLSQLLGDYVEDFDTDLSFWNGQVELNDLKVKRSALDYFDIPISILDGRIGRIEMEIPWTQLLSFNVSPVVVTIKDVNIVLQPRMCVPWDPEREETVNYNVKKKKLEHHEQFETLRSSWRNNTDQDQTWSGKLAEAFGGNLQLRIENVHIRYEDLSNRRHPVVFGITLDSFVLEDLEAEDHVFSKNLNLNGFAFYGNLNRKQTLIGLLLKRKKIFDLVQTMEKIKNEKDYDYILDPLSGDTEVQWQKDRENPDLDRPLFAIDANYDRFKIGMDARQWDELLQTADYFTEFRKYERYRKDRPDCSLEDEKCRKNWWIHFINCTKQELQDKQFTWSQVEDLKKKREEYIPLYKRKLGASWLSKLDVFGAGRLESLEKELEYEAIVMYREIAKKEMGIETERNKTFMWTQRDEEKLEKEKKAEAEMFGGSDGSSSESEENESEESNSQQSGSDDEQDGQTKKEAEMEKEDAKREFPKEYVLCKGWATLKQFEVELRTHKRAPITKLTLDDMRSTTDVYELSVKTDFTLEDMLLLDSYHKRTQFKEIIRRRNDKGKPLVKVCVATHPNRVSDIKSNGDLYISIHMAQTEMIVNVPFMQRCLSFFAVPSSINLKALEQLIKRQVTYVGEKAADKLRQALEDQWIFDVHFKYNAPTILIPENWNEKHTELVVIDLGIFDVKSEEVQSSKERLHKLDEITDEDYYTYFNVRAKKLKVITCNSDEWFECKTINQIVDKNPQKNIIVHETSLKARYSQCLLVHSTEQPISRIEGFAEKLRVDFSPEKIRRLIHTFNAIIDFIDYPIGTENQHISMSGRLILVNGPTLHRMTMDPDNDELPDTGRGGSSKLHDEKEVEEGIIFEQQPQRQEYWAELHDGGKLLLYEHRDHKRETAVASIDVVHKGPKLMDRDWRFGLRRRMNMLKEKRIKAGAKEAVEMDVPHTVKEETAQKELKDNQFKIVLPAKHGVKTYFVFEVPDEEEKEEIDARKRDLSHEHFDVWRYGYQDMSEEEISEEADLTQRKRIEDPVDILREEHKQSGNQEEYEGNKELLREWCRRFHDQCITHALFKLEAPTAELEDTDEDTKNLKELQTKRVLSFVLLQLNHFHLGFSYHRLDRGLKKTEEWKKEQPFFDIYAERLVIGYISRQFDWTMDVKLRGFDLVDRTVDTQGEYPLIATSRQYDLAKTRLEQIDEYSRTHSEEFVTMEYLYLADEESEFFDRKCDMMCNLTFRKLHLYLDAITVSCFAEMWHDIKDVFQELIGRTAFFVTYQGVSGPQELLTSDRLTFKTTASMKLCDVYLLDFGKPIMLATFLRSAFSYGYNGRTTQYEGQIGDICATQLRSEVPTPFREVLKSSSKTSLIDFKYEQRIADSLERNSDDKHKADKSDEKDGITIAPYWVADLSAKIKEVNLVLMRGTVDLLHKWIYKSPLYESCMEADKRAMKPEQESARRAAQLLNVNISISKSVVVIPASLANTETVTCKIGYITLRTESTKKSRVRIQEVHRLKIAEVLIGTTDDYQGRHHLNQPDIEPIMDQLELRWDVTREVALSIRDVKRTGEKVKEKELRDFMKAHTSEEDYDPEDISSGRVAMDVHIPEIKVCLKHKQYRRLVSAWQNNIAVSEFEELDMQKFTADMPEREQLRELLAIEKKKEANSQLEHGSTWFLRLVSKGATLARNWATSGWIFTSPEELYNKKNFDTGKIEHMEEPAIMMIHVDREDRIKDEVMKIEAKFNAPHIGFKLEDMIEFNVHDIDIDFDQQAKAVRPSDQQPVLEDVSHIRNRVVSETQMKAQIGKIELLDVRQNASETNKQILSLAHEDKLLQLDVDIKQNDANSHCKVADLKLVVNSELAEQMGDYIRAIDKEVKLQKHYLPKTGDIIIRKNISLYHDLKLSPANRMIIGGAKEIVIDGMGREISLQGPCFIVEDGVSVKLINAMFKYDGKFTDVVLLGQDSHFDAKNGVMKQQDAELEVKHNQIRQMLLKILEYHIMKQEKRSGNTDEMKEKEDEIPEDEHAEQHNLENKKEQREQEKKLTEHPAATPSMMCMHMNWDLGRHTISIVNNATTLETRMLQFEFSAALQVETNDEGQEVYRLGIDQLQAYSADRYQNQKKFILHPARIAAELVTPEHPFDARTLTRTIRLVTDPIKLRIGFQDVKMVSQFYNSLGIPKKDEKAPKDDKPKENEYEKRSREEKQQRLRQKVDDESLQLVTRYNMDVKLNTLSAFIVDDVLGFDRPLICGIMENLMFKGCTLTVNKYQQDPDATDVNPYNTYEAQVNASAVISAKFYNVMVADWEPVAEPYEFSLIYNVEPIWEELTVEKVRNTFTGISQDTVRMIHSQQIIANTACDQSTLNFVVSRSMITTAIQTMNSWQKEFKEEANNWQSVRHSPYLVRNYSGQPITIQLQGRDNAELVDLASVKDLYWVENEADDVLSLPERNAIVQIGDQAILFNMHRFGTNPFALGDAIGIVDVEIADGRRQITVRSAYKVINSSHTTVEVAVSLHDAMYPLGEIEPGESIGIPFGLTPGMLRVRLVDNKHIIPWSESSQTFLLSYIGAHTTSQTISSKLPYSLNISVTSAMSSIDITLRTPLSIRNLLFCPVRIDLMEGEKVLSPGIIITPGERFYATHFSAKSWLWMKVVPLDRPTNDWECQKPACIYSPSAQESSHIECHRDTEQVTIHFDYTSEETSARELVLYTQYWIVNHTQHPLAIEQVRKREKIMSKLHVHSKALTKAYPLTYVGTDATLFSFTEKTRRIALHLNGGVSESFSIDEQPDTTTTVACVSDRRYAIGVHIRDPGDCFGERTKIVMLSPQFVVTNDLPYKVRFGQTNDKEVWTMPSKSTASYYPMLNVDSPTIQFAMEIDGIEWTSSPVQCDTTGDARLKLTSSVTLNQKQITVSRKQECGSIFITLQELSSGANFEIINEISQDLRIQQSGSENYWHLTAGSTLNYAWDNENGTHEFIFKPLGNEVIYAPVAIDPVSTTNSILHLPGDQVAFVGLEKHPGKTIIRITNQEYVQAAAYSSPVDTNDRERLAFILSVTSIGLSFVDDQNKFEALYAYAEDVNIKYSSTASAEYLDATLGMAQIDNMVPETAFPVMFNSISEDDNDYITLSICRKDANTFPYAELAMNDFAIRTDTRFVAYATKLYDQISRDIEPMDYPKYIREQCPLQEEKKEQDEKKDLYHFDRFGLSEFKARGTFRFDKKTPMMMPNALMRTLCAINVTVDDAPLHAQQFVLDNVKIDQTELLQRLENHYWRQLKKEFVKVIGSLDVLGNPVGLVQDVKSIQSRKIIGGTVRSAKSFTNIFHKTNKKKYTRATDQKLESVQRIRYPRVLADGKITEYKEYDAHKRALEKQFPNLQVNALLASSHNPKVTYVIGDSELAKVKEYGKETTVKWVVGMLNIQRVETDPKSGSVILHGADFERKVHANTYTDPSISIFLAKHDNLTNQKAVC